MLDAATATIYATVLVSSVVLLIDAGADPADPSAALAAVLVAFGLGSIAVAVALPALLRRLRDTTVMLLGAGVAALVLAGTAAAALLDGLSVLGIGALWAVLGASSSAISTPSARLIRTEVAADQHAAVFAARFSTSHAWYAVTYPVAGLLGTIAPLGAATAALAGLAAVAVVAGLAMVPPRSPD